MTTNVMSYSYSILIDYFTKKIIEKISSLLLLLFNSNSYETKKSVTRMTISSWARKMIWFVVSILAWTLRIAEKSFQELFLPMKWHIYIGGNGYCALLLIQRATASYRLTTWVIERERVSEWMTLCAYVWWYSLEHCIAKKKQQEKRRKKK